MFVRVAGGPRGRGREAEAKAEDRGRGKRQRLRTEAEGHLRSSAVVAHLYLGPAVRLSWEMLGCARHVAFGRAEVLLLVRVGEANRAEAKRGKAEAGEHLGAAPLAACRSSLPRARGTWGRLHAETW